MQLEEARAILVNGGLIAVQAVSGRHEVIDDPDDLGVAGYVTDKQYAELALDFEQRRIKSPGCVAAHFLVATLLEGTKRPRLEANQKVKLRHAHEVRIRRFRSKNLLGSDSLLLDKDLTVAEVDTRTIRITGSQVAVVRFTEVTEADCAPFAHGTHYFPESWFQLA